MTEPKKRGRPPGEANLKRRVAGKAYGTREFKNLVLETIKQVPTGEQTIDGILKIWGDPLWHEAEAKLDLRRVISRFHDQGNLIRIDRGVYEVAEILKLTASHDIQLLAEQALREAGGFMKAKALRKALGYSSQDAVNANLFTALRMEGSRIRRDCHERYTYNLPEPDLKRLILPPIWASAYYRGVYLGAAPSPEPGATPWMEFFDSHIAKVGEALYLSRKAAGAELEDVLDYPAITKALDAARIRNPARLTNREIIRQIEEMPDNIIVVGHRETRAGKLVEIRATTPRDESDPRLVDIRNVRLDILANLESPRPDQLHPEHFDRFDYESLGRDFFEAWGSVFHIDPVALSWGNLGLREDGGWHSVKGSKLTTNVTALDGGWEEEPDAEGD